MLSISKDSNTKALSKQEEPNVFWDARFLNPFFEF
jgi:hypothetical protein